MDKQKTEKQIKLRIYLTLLRFFQSRIMSANFTGILSSKFKKRFTRGEKLSLTVLVHLFVKFALFNCIIQRVWQSITAFLFDTNP